MSASTPSYLMVIGPGSSSMFPLPSVGVVTVGRGGEADLPIEHPSVSRRHARFLIERGEVRVADLDSHNGTRVNGEVLAGTRALGNGDLVVIGEITLALIAPPRAASPAVLDEAAWRRRLEVEVERAQTYGRALAVLVTAPAPSGIAVTAALRTIDVAAITEDGRVLALLPEADRATATRVAAAFGRLASGLRVGIATCPSDAVDPDNLVLAARAAVDGEGGIRHRLGEREVLIAHPAMIRVFALLERLAAADLPVLIIGETGAGKEHAAYAVHHHSPRRERPFVPLNCAALPETLVESELFGHDKGAFSGAHSARAGVLETVAGGTLFLDEIGELAPPVQAKLLRAIESQRICRLGEHRERPIDVRIVAATHRVLEDEVKAGRFRQDLYFRIGGARVHLPPLRDRRCEIPLLFRQFVAAAAARAGRPPPELPPATMTALLGHSWPGNVRELRHAAEYLVAAGELPAGVAAVPASPGDGAARSLADEIEELERRRMREALHASGGVKARAAQALGMPLRTFTSKLKHYGLG